VVQSVAMVEQGILPDDGGWHDQAATWVQAHPILARELAHWREVRMEQDRKEAERKRKR